MAAAAAFSAGKFIIQIGDAGGTEVFAEPCAVVEGKLAFSKSVSETVLPDCEDPDAPGWTDRDATAFSAEITGSGVATKAGMNTIEAAFLATASRNMRIQHVGGGSGGATPDKRYAGAFHITSLDYDRSRGEKLAFSFTAQSDGAVTITSVAALA